MRKFIFVGALALTVTLYAPSGADAGQRGGPSASTQDAQRGPVRQFVAKVVERWKARTARVGRFACEVATTVRPVVTVGFEKSRPTLAFSYQWQPACANGVCPASK